MERPITARAALLQIVAQGEGTGAELNARLREKTKGKLFLNNNTLYPALAALEAAGFVAGTDRARPGRPERVFEPTRKGKKAADATRAIVMDLFEE